MKRACFVILVITLFWGFSGYNASAQVVELSEFLYTTQIETNFTPNVLNCLPLKREIISETHNNFSDLRIFDNDGHETPYVIYGEKKPPREIKTFTFKVISYQEGDGLTEIVIEKPKSGTSYSSILFITSNRDFKKAVTIMGSSKRKMWNHIATEAIFDFTSRVDLRKTTIKTDEVDYAYLKISMEDDSSDGEESIDIKLRYNGLEFAVGSDQKKIFHIDRIIGSNGISAPPEEVLEYAYCNNRDIFTDTDGNTVINLGRVNLPVTEITLQVDNPYYYRSVELLESDSGEEESFHTVGNSTIYKIADMKNPEDTIRCSQQPHRKYLQLKILNGDNPQLQIRTIKIGWLKQNLYFIPESGKSYSLYFGSDKAKMPRYELKNLIEPEYEKLKQYQVISTESIKSNPYYKPQKPVVDNRRKIEKSILTSIVLILVGGLGYWVYRLMKRIPTELKE